MKHKGFITVLFLLVPIALFCKSSNEGLGYDLGLLVFGALGFIAIVGALLTIINIDVSLNESLREDSGLTKTEDNKSFYDTLKERLIDIVPLEKEMTILLDHDYDGIQELDNKLPPWWLYGFYFSILFGIVYVGFYHYSDYGKTSHEEYNYEMEQAEFAVSQYLERQANSIDEKNLAALTDEENLTIGLSIFKSNCIACHLESGGGSPMSVGPNLTDEYWLHGGGIQNIFKTVKYGVPEKGMIAWKDQLGMADMHRVSSYILTLQGTNPPNAKEPQGELYKTEDEKVADE